MQSYCNEREKQKEKAENELFVKPDEQSCVCSKFAMARIFVQTSAIELAHIAERSRKCQEKRLLKTN